jgi:hypothetical protein
MASIAMLSMADSRVEGKRKKVPGRYGVLEKIPIDGCEANRLDARGKMRYKPFVYLPRDPPARRRRTASLAIGQCWPTADGMAIGEDFGSWQQTAAIRMQREHL